VADATYNEVRMAGPAFVPAVETPAYTANTPQLVCAVVKQIVIVNTSNASTAAVGISLVAGGGAGATSNRLVPDALTLEPGAVVTLDLAQVMRPGDAISWKASVANRVVVTISGLEKIGG
jgi:hypothetical protein